MFSRLRQALSAFDWWRPALTGVFLVAALLVGLFAVRTLRETHDWRRQRDKRIERWMTVDYVAHAYVVSPETLWEALGPSSTIGKHQSGRGDHRPLGEIAVARGQTFEQVRKTIEDAIARTRAVAPSPPSTATRDNRGSP